MASSSPFTLKWGIMATGWIAESELNLLKHPKATD